MHILRRGDFHPRFQSKAGFFLKNKEDMKYGLNYQGSKSALCPELCSLFPIRSNFYDLFSGGCAVSHRMIELGQFNHYFLGDINPLPLKLFMQCLRGDVPAPRWIGKEEFDKVKAVDPYAACLFSFGGDWQTYAYGKDIEPLKKAVHYAVVDCDFSLTDKLSVDLRELLNFSSWQKRRIEVKRILRDWNRIEELQHLERLVQLEHLSRLVHLERLANLGDIALWGAKRKNNHSIMVSTLSDVDKNEGISYKDVKILPDSVVYCDIPYKETKGYTSGAFDYDSFYDWCREQKELVLISEYSMPDDFVCVKEFYRMDSKAANSVKRVTERVFVPGHQVELYQDNKTVLF